VEGVNKRSHGEQVQEVERARKRGRDGWGAGKERRRGDKNEWTGARREGRGGEGVKEGSVRRVDKELGKNAEKVRAGWTTQRKYGNFNRETCLCTCRHVGTPLTREKGKKRLIRSYLTALNTDNIRSF